MNTWRTALTLGLLALALTARAQPVMNDPAQGGWRGEELQQQLAQWARIVAEHPDDQQARLNLFRTTRNAALARHAGTIPPTDQAQLSAITADLARRDADGFETHIAQFHLHFPAAAAWAHLTAAARVGADRLELIAPQLVGAARTGDQKAMARHARDLVDRGGLSPALLSLAGDILLSVGPDAVLIAAGEMDAHAVWARQYARGERRDVLTIDQRLLADATYRRTVWTQAGAKGEPPTELARFVEHLAGATTRPVYCSLALGPDRLAPLSDRLYVTGLAARYSTTPIDNISTLAANWPRMAKVRDAGPLARNYLLPGALLLEHHRQRHNEDAFAPLEHELRGLARDLGATDLLYRAGVLHH
jgi:hypothetical protein